MDPDCDTGVDACIPANDNDPDVIATAMLQGWAAATDPDARPWTSFRRPARVPRLVWLDG
jgi:hypothetical protein